MKKVFSVCGPQKRKMGKRNSLQLGDWEAEAQKDCFVPVTQTQKSNQWPDVSPLCCSSLFFMLHCPLRLGK